MKFFPFALRPLISDRFLISPLKRTPRKRHSTCRATLGRIGRRDPHFNGDLIAGFDRVYHHSGCTSRFYHRRGLEFHVTAGNPAYGRLIVHNKVQRRARDFLKGIKNQLTGSNASITITVLRLSLFAEIHIIYPVLISSSRIISKPEDQTGVTDWNGKVPCGEVYCIRIPVCCKVYPIAI